MGCAMCRDEDKQVFLAKDQFASAKKDLKVVALDCSVKGKEAYTMQRIPDAFYLDLDQWADGAMPTAKELTQVCKNIGVGTDTKICCYDSTNGIAATKAAMLLQASGVQSVSVLNYVFTEDVANKKSETAQADPKPLTAQAALWKENTDSLFMPEAEWANVMKGTTRLTVVDMREEREFKERAFGKNGAVNLTLADFYQSAKHATASETDVQKKIHDAKLKTDDTIVVCGGGNDAFVMAAVLQQNRFTKVRICSMSFEDWNGKHPYKEEPATNDADDEAAKKKKADDEAAAKQKEEDEAAAKKKAEEEKAQE